MSPASFNQIKTLCIVFPGAAGGHHLANLISCCNEFIQYHQPEELLDLYTKYDQYLDLCVPDINELSVQDYPAWIMMSWPRDGTLPGIRRIKMNSQAQIQGTYHWPNTYIQHTNSLCDDYGFNLNTEQFWSKEGSNYLRELLLNNFGIHLPSVADNIHAIWWRWMTKVLDTEMP